MGSTFTNLVYHVIFSTKYREPLITPNIQNDLYHYIGKITKNEGGRVLKIGGMPDHMHVLIKLKPVHSLSKIMQQIKGGSSKWVNDQQRLQQRFAWQVGYGAFSVSESQVGVVERYIGDQERHHQKVSFKGEFMQLLERHGVEFEERTLWG